MPPDRNGAPCPACGVTHEELVAVRARRAMADAWRAWDRHARSCTAGCAPTRSARCDEGERLAGLYFDRWAAWLAAAGEGGDADGRDLPA